tara:strand:- start:1696 stop:1896 length:201 start_codon:yes stop_codon:yes gene_type:complete
MAEKMILGNGENCFFEAAYHQHALQDFLTLLIGKLVLDETPLLCPMRTISFYHPVGFIPNFLGASV